MSKVADILETLEYGPAPEARDAALAWIGAHAGGFGHFIGGHFTDPARLFDVFNPADGGLLARVSNGSSPVVAEAVSAAREAQPAWADAPGHRRARHLYALARSIQRHARLFAVLESLDTGKPIRESRDLDIPLVARHFYHHAGWAQLQEREFPHHEALGVVGQIIPWNFPLLMLAWKVAPALATGNTVVLKPAEYTPLTALLFAEICVRVGLPDGVFNLVTGDGDTGAALVEADVDKIAFTGSTEVGRSIRKATAGSGKRLSLELGGKSPFVVFEDADLDSVVEGVVDAIWFNQGQVCCAGSRILVQESVAPLLERKLRARMETLRMGDPLDKSVDMGAIVAPVQLQRIQELVEQGREEGARIWQPSWATPQEGWFYPPTLCTEVQPAGTLARVEIFGPVVAMMTFRTPDEAVILANDTRYGLAASVWSENLNLALDTAPAIKAGTVWVNCTNLFDAASGFGGYRESGFGREGGREGIREYLRYRTDSDGPGPAEGPWASAVPAEVGLPESGVGSNQQLDRTAKLYIGGEQTRPDGEATLLIRTEDGETLGTVGRGSRKDIRNAVEAASAAQPGWSRRTAHNRAQILYFWAENLEAREEEFGTRLQEGGESQDRARAEIAATISRLFSYGAWADKWDGRVHSTPFRNVTLAVPEALGVVGAVCPETSPLLGFVSVVAPLVAMGNAVVAVPSQGGALSVTDLYQVLETSDLPGGVVNIVTGLRHELVPTLAAHDEVDGIWYHGPSTPESGQVEELSVGNLKRSWVNHGRSRDWMDPGSGEGDEFLHQATQIKNIWIPYGE